MILGLCTFGLLVAGCGGQTLPRPRDMPPADERDAVLVTELLTLEFLRSPLHVDGGPLVIECDLSIAMLHDEDDMGRFEAKLVRSAARHDERLVEAAHDFCRKNLRTQNVSIIGRIGVPHVIMKPNGFHGWKKFHAQYPRSPGIIQLSRPGYSVDGSIALIYMGTQFDWLAGAGTIHVLEHIEGQWRRTSIYLPFGYVS